jgi:thiol-disulfide isomerase/thioredoxin
MKFLCSLLLAAGLLSCTPEPAKTPSSPATPRAAAPHFELENIAGGTTKSDDLKGRVSIVDIWATWCEPCITEIPKFNRLYEQYKEKDVRVVGVTVLSPHDTIASKAKEFGMKYTVLVGNDDIVDGFGGVIGWPTTFVLTKDLQIYKKYVGALPDKEDRIKKDIEALLTQSD